MRPYFEYYTANLDRWPIELGVDLALIEKAPIAGLTHRVHLRLNLNHPTADGLCCQEESALLLAVEEEILSSLPKDSFCYVAHVTHRGRRTIILYMDGMPQPGQPLLDAVERVETHTTLLQFEEDPEWKEYLEYLYPNEGFRHQIKDRRVLKEFERRGDDPARNHSIEPVFSGLDEQGALELRKALESVGFMVGDVANVSNNGVTSWRVIGKVKSPLALSILDDYREIWMALAKEQGGHYDGWSAEVLPIGEGDGPASQ